MLFARSSDASPDEDMTPWDMAIDYKVSLFLYLSNDKTKNWLLLDEILTYGYVKPQDLWLLTKETSRSIPPRSFGASRVIPIEYDHMHP
jgi:hypothetical protein